MWIKKLNTTTYHPQTDGLVERFNRTLLDVLSKTVKSGGQDWDFCLPYVHFAYRTVMQHLSGEYPFFLLYDSDPQLPMKAALCPQWYVEQFLLMIIRAICNKLCLMHEDWHNKLLRKLNRNRRYGMIRKQETLHLAQEIESLCTCLLSDQAKLTS